MQSCDDLLALAHATGDHCRSSSCGAMRCVPVTGQLTFARRRGCRFEHTIRCRNNAANMHTKMSRTERLSKKEKRLMSKSETDFLGNVSHLPYSHEVLWLHRLFPLQACIIAVEAGFVIDCTPLTLSHLEIAAYTFSIHPRDVSCCLTMLSSDKQILLP